MATCLGVLYVLPGEDVTGDDEPGPGPGHLGHLRARESLQGPNHHYIKSCQTIFYIVAKNSLRCPVHCTTYPILKVNGTESDSLATGLA